MSYFNFGYIRHCLEALFPKRVEFTHRFYERFFQLEPAAKHLFSQGAHRQGVFLYASMTMLATCLGAGRDLTDELAEFGRLHARVSVDESMFPAFGQAFLETMIEFLPDHDPHEIAAAWHPTWEKVSAALIDGIRDGRAQQRAAVRVFGSRDSDEAASKAAPRATTGIR